MPYMYALYVCLICMPYMYALYVLYVCLICMPYMYVLYVCLIRMPYMYALYVCLICMPYMQDSLPSRTPSPGSSASSADGRRAGDRVHVLRSKYVLNIRRRP